jgi:hypothetical protein
MATEQFHDPLAALQAAEEAAFAAAHGEKIPPPVQMVPETSISTLEDMPAPIPSEPPPPTPPAPAETPPAPVEVPPAEPPLPPAAATPETPPVQKPKEFQPDETQAAKRRQREAEEELQRERQRTLALEQERARLIAQAEEQQRQARGESIPEEVDPITQLQQKIAQLEHTVQQQQQVNQQDSMLNAQVQSFMQAGHPDYPQAYQAYVESEIQQAELSGEIEVVASRLRQVQGEQIRQQAIQIGKTEAEVSRDLAKGVLFEARKQGLIQGSQHSGKSVAEMIYELAKMRGYTPANGNGNGNGNHGEPAPPPLPANTPSAANEIRAEQRSASEGSLAALPTGTAPPVHRITSRTQLMSMPPIERDRWIERMDRCTTLPPNSPDWQPQNWHELLTD